MSPEMTACSLESFCKAFEGILEGITDGNSAKKNKLTADRSAMSTIHRLLSVPRDSDSSTADESNAWELNDALLSEWEESAPPSAAVQQLVSLLSKPVIKSVLWTQSQVMECRYWPQLPDVPYEVDDDEGVAVKVVRLVKGNEPLGATIKCDADGCVFVARIIAGGVADRSACIQVRDRVMEVNGVSVTGMKPADIVKLLNTEDGSVSFKLIPAEIPTVVNCDETRYVKALSDYRGSSDKLHPCPEAALSFAQGDILQLVVTEDEHWWQATCLGRAPFAKPDDDSFDGRRRIGLIPSEVLHRKRKSLRDCEGRRGSVRQSSKNIVQSNESALYETVSLLPACASLIRPIVLIGASGVGRNELKRRLIITNCERYSTTVPHTSRPPRTHETEGVDYFFVGRPEMEQWIRQGRFLEFGEYKANLYGTLADSVLNLIAQGRTPVLNPHPLALRMLRSSAFKPFVIFVQPPDFDTFKETRAQHRARCMPSEESARGAVNGHVDSVSYPRGFSDAEIQHIVSSSKQLYQLYAACCDVVLVNGSLEQTFAQLSHILNKLHTQPTWVPSLWLD